MDSEDRNVVLISVLQDFLLDLGIGLMVLGYYYRMLYFILMKLTEETSRSEVKGKRISLLLVDAKGAQMYLIKHGGA
jgi:hypothetical protein